MAAAPYPAAQDGTRTLMQPLASCFLTTSPLSSRTLCVPCCQVSIENPLAVADYSWQYGVSAIPETEEAIADMGHLADESVLVNFEQGVVLGAEDFVDPTLAFGDPGGRQQEGRGYGHSCGHWCLSSGGIWAVVHQAWLGPCPCRAQWQFQRSAGRGGELFGACTAEPSTKCMSCAWHSRRVGVPDRHSSSSAAAAAAPLYRYRRHDPASTPQPLGPAATCSAG